MSSICPTTLLLNCLKCGESGYREVFFDRYTCLSCSSVSVAEVDGQKMINEFNLLIASFENLLQNKDENEKKLLSVRKTLWQNGVFTKKIGKLEVKNGFYEWRNNKLGDPTLIGLDNLFANDELKTASFSKLSQALDRVIFAGVHKDIFFYGIKKLVQLDSWKTEYFIKKEKKYGISLDQLIEILKIAKNKEYNKEGYFFKKNENGRFNVRYYFKNKIYKHSGWFATKKEAFAFAVENFGISESQIKEL